MNTEVLTAFRELGFKVEKFNNNVYGLTYGHVKLVYRVYPDDENFFDIGTSFDITGMTAESAHALANNLNLRLKFVKVYIYENKLWASCERNLSIISDIRQLVKDSVYCMINATQFYLDTKQGGENESMEAN